VGDDINDAPVVAAAHTSIAPATADDIGRNAAISSFFVADDQARRSDRQWGVMADFLFLVPIALAPFMWALAQRRSRRGEIG
jgi:hypothetical protein